MKKFLKGIGKLLGLGILILIFFGWYINKDLPQGKQGSEADVLAHKMLQVLNYQAYKQTRFLEWSYRNGANKYVWDTFKGEVSVKWKDYTVFLNLSKPGESQVEENQAAVPSKNKQKLIDKAISNFNNDSFWLIAPYKVFDEGTQRSLVQLPDGSNGLLVTYNSGGTTPGDSYLWILNEDGFPKAYKMWVDIIPIGGLEASWDDWIVTQSGAFLPKSHKLGPLTLDMGDVKGY